MQGAARWSEEDSMARCGESVPAAVTGWWDCARTVTLLRSFFRRLLRRDLRGSMPELKAEQLRWLSPPELNALLVGDTTAMVRKAGCKLCNDVCSN